MGHSARPALTAEFPPSPRTLTQVSESLLYNWRSAWKAAASARTSEPVEFLRLGVIGHGESMPLLSASEPAASVGQPEDRAGRIEISLPCGARVSVDGLVNEKALARVLRVLKASA
jgi:transposase-like protein